MKPKTKLTIKQLRKAKPLFLIPPIKSKHIRCLNCSHTESILPLTTVLYHGFGGWTISVNNIQFFQQRNNTEYDAAPILKKIERVARQYPHHDWRANVNLPLRDAEYQRQGKNKWVLIKTGPGFA